MKFETGRVNLVKCGIEAMRSLENDSIDVIITDPPYSDRTHAGARTLKHVNRGNSGLEGPSVLIDFEPMTEAILSGFLEQAARICKRWIVMTFDIMLCETLQRYCMGYNLDLVRIGAWIKPDGAPQFTGDRPGQGWEPVYILHRKGKKRWNGRGKHGVWIEGIVKTAAKYPTEKPLNLIASFVRLFSEPGDLILDPFSGSGVTGVAAIKMGRGFLGFDVEPRAVELANDKLARVEKQPLLVGLNVAQGKLDFC